jgi:hypothetical protein
MACMACAGLAWGETRFCVTVRDPAGLAVPGVAVAVKPMAAAAILHGATGEDGRFCENLAPGVYLIRAEKDQFEGAADSMTVAPGQPRLERELVLRITPVASQMEVTTSRLPASLTEAPGNFGIGSASKFQPSSSGRSARCP